MRAIGTPKLLSWRWAPCVALAAGAGCFVAFAMFAIPERIGNIPAPPAGAAAAFRLNVDSSVASNQGPSTPISNTDSASRSSTSFSSLPSNAPAHVAANAFPKRGFSPPLERPEPPPAPPPVVPQQPALQVAPPAPTFGGAPLPLPPGGPPQAPPPEPPSDPQAAAALLEQGLRVAE